MSLPATWWLLSTNPVVRLPAFRANIVLQNLQFEQLACLAGVFHVLVVDFSQVQVPL
jgi:hypothetical protein